MTTQVLASVATTASPDIDRWSQFEEYCEVIDCTQTTLEALTEQ